MRNLKQNFCAAMLIPVIATLLFGCAIYKDMNRPIIPDAELESMFHQNRPYFEELVRMSEADSGVSRIAYDFTWVAGEGSSSDTGDPGITRERWDQYRRLFHRLGIQNGISREEDGAVAFLAFGRGLAVSGLSKGYLFTRRDRNCSAKSLDDLDKYREQHFICKRIDENWYLFVSK